MNIVELGAIGELVGGVAVIVTLLYLAAQIRQNTRSGAAAAFHSASSSVMEIRQALFERADVAHIYFAGLADVDSLDAEERLRFRLLMHNVFWSFGNSYTQGRLSQATEDEMDAVIAGVRRIVRSPGARWFWADYRQEFDPTFRDVVDALLDELEA